MLWKLFSVYLMFFYTDICGIDAWVVGVLFLVTRIWDSLLDPVVGLLCDHIQPVGPSGRGCCGAPCPSGRWAS
ncbi:MAG: MFS transporter [Alistipes sp.]